MTAGRTSLSPADDPAKAELLKLARRHSVKVRLRRAARLAGEPFVELRSRPGDLQLGVFRDCSAASRFLAGGAR
ncbi:hypothetical protein [Piscinibacter defluvii]|uniref:hypothetical protein n=1 Tax=Piscinibacter defluvii TaxID=1796922 RepID=UPI000FDD9265|nr:hypothetical protein [Piscinibacter defluvii]